MPRQLFRRPIQGSNVLELYSILFYWYKTIVPVNLLPFYPNPGKPNGLLPGIFNMAIIGFVIFVAGA